MQSFVVRGGTLYDGSGAPPRQADVLVRQGRIEQVAPGLAAGDLPVVDAAGYVVTPGFVDIHRHHDLALFRDPDFGQVELAQGITTAFCGNCGLAPVPLDPVRDAPFFTYLEPVVGPLPAGLPLETHSYAGYAASLRGADLPLNIGFMAGMGAVRYAVKGFSADPFTPEEQRRAAELVDEAMEAGASGVSLGIMYRPECYTSAPEYDAIIAPAARRDGILCTHIRGEGDSLVESVQEVIDLAARTGIRLNVSHFKATGIRNWRDKIFRAIDCIETARAKGQPVTADFYPYDGGSTTLLSLLPPDLMEKDPAWFGTAAGRQALRDEIYREHPGWDNMALSIGWQRILLSSVQSSELAADQGQPFDAIAAKHHYDDPADLMADLIAAEGGNVGIIVLSMDWQDVQAVAKLPYTVLISDSLYAGGGSPHPRLYGSFPRMLRLLAGEERLMPMEQAIAKMTALPAARMGLRDRGLVQPGQAADLLVFDPGQFRDTASYGSPKNRAQGLHLAYLNGQNVWADGPVPGAKAGQYLAKK